MTDDTQKSESKLRGLPDKSNAEMIWAIRENMLNLAMAMGRTEPDAVIELATKLTTFVVFGTPKVGREAAGD